MIISEHCFFELLGAQSNILLPQNRLESLLILGTVCAILLVCGIFVILHIRKTLLAPDTTTNDEQLLQFSQMYDEGELSKEEYRLIKLRFARVMKEQEQRMGVVSAVPVAAAPPPSRKKTKKKKNKESGKTEEDREKMLRSLLKGFDDEY